MAELKPFHAVRYVDTDSLVNVVTQPYDKIPPALKERYLARDPHNLVRLIKPDAPDEETTAYEHSADLFRAWCEQGVLARDSLPGFYPYRQQYVVGGDCRTRTGFIGLCKVEPYSRKIVFPHERTLSKPKADRLSLLRAGRVHYGLIFMLYEGTAAAQARVDQAMESEAVARFTDDDGVVHELWTMTDPSQVAALQAALADSQLFIADGHHRYETSLAYAGENPSDEAAQYALAMFVNVNGPLTVLPTHRVVHSLEHYNPRAVLKSLRQMFAVEKCRSLKDALKSLERSSDAPRIVWFDGDTHWLLTLGDEAAMRAAAPAHSDAWRALDVAVLHTLVIENALGISSERVAGEEHISYHRDPAEAERLVKKGSGNCCFFLRATAPVQVCEVARAGDVMPQKSTDFYPKMLSGLAMYALDA
jgi:uncharacterized protein (DUF1015 family)